VTAFKYIDSVDELEKCCLILQQSSLLAVDTEFVRERTFYPQPGLIQVSNGSDISLIDPIACKSLQAFFNLLESPEITIIMHSCSEDIELFYSMGCGTIENLFDTQIAASWLGLGQSLSLQKLVEHHENITLEKQLTRTNWLKRPLSEAQLEYAAMDVLYLNVICCNQQNSLREIGFLDYNI
jgi:ribonuclease D